MGDMRGGAPPVKEHDGGGEEESLAPTDSE